MNWLSWLRRGFTLRPGSNGDRLKQYIRQLEAKINELERELVEGPPDDSWSHLARKLAYAEHELFRRENDKHFACIFIQNNLDIALSLLTEEARAEYEKRIAERIEI